jgi:hypothetical protein
LAILVAIQTLLKQGGERRGERRSPFGVHVSSEGFDWQVRWVEREEPMRKSEVVWRIKIPHPGGHKSSLWLSTPLVDPSRLP